MNYSEAHETIFQNDTHASKVICLLGYTEKQIAYIQEHTHCSYDDAKKIADEVSEIIYKHRREHNITVKPTTTCPYCKSANTSKIGTISRSVSFGLFGFGSSKVGKQWHCNDCRSDF